MKKSVPLTTALFCALNFLISCSVSKNSVQQTNSVIEKASETASSCFVQLNDGSVQHYSTLKLVTGVLVTPHLLADNKVVINARNIKAYQNKKHYAVSKGSLTQNKTTAVSVETLPGFAIRVVEGKLNVYARKFYNGVYTLEEYFLQSGDDGEIVAYSPESLTNLIKDNTKAVEYFKSKTKYSQKAKRLLAVAEFYNNQQMISKN
jgi:hypothetical protein